MREMIMGSIQREEWCAGVYLTKLITQAEDIEDYVSMAALLVALQAINADGKINETTAETILQYVSFFAACILYRAAPELSINARDRFETIRDTARGLPTPVPTK
jgi:hypothetical protein